MRANSAPAGRPIFKIARHKSNRDYEAELARRGAGAGPLARVFAENRRLLEHVWYGRHVPAEDEVVRFQANVRHLLGGGA